MITTFVNIVKALYYTIACYRYNSFPDDNRRGTFSTYGFLYKKINPLKLCVYTVSRIFGGVLFAILAIS